MPPRALEQLNHIPAGQLDWAALILFGAMLIVGLADDGAHRWLMENANLMSDIAVLVMTLGGMAIGRPFALMYARLSPKFEAAWEQDTNGFRAWGFALASEFHSSGSGPSSFSSAASC